MTWAWIITLSGLLAWAALAAMVLATCRRLRTLPTSSAKEQPLVSVICPARDEADEIENAIRSRLRDPSRSIEFILVDDRSNDETGAILDRLAKEDDRIRVVHVEELPTGWLGKVHAQQRGIEQSRGDWLLFSDGDVHLEPNLLNEALAWSQQEEADHVALLPRIIRGPLLMHMCLPILMIVLISVLKLWRANDDRANRAMGVGAFNLVRRDALEKAGGMEPLRMEIADDVGLATIIQESGGRSRLAIATDRLRVPWYRSTRDFLQGTEKGAAKFGSRLQLVLHAFINLVLSLVVLSPFVMLALWSNLPLAVALVALAGVLVAIGTTLTTAIRFALPMTWAILVPISLLVAIIVGQRSIWLAITRGGVRWRGDVHSLEAAQAGSRVKL